ncbi:flagellin lysine-N-methylase [Paenibacillus sp. KN14-4R]|uniref:flagellin lysine-N-methylase n=1 Tax=Paenibacillus sp. KN14-4R TaxID=3445773 RepID=UPI003F9F3A53
MSTKQTMTLVPKYMAEFKCIGGECEDTCCNGWQVHIDQKTYKQYNRVKDRELAGDLNKYVKRVRSGVNDQAYARIIMNEEGDCRFLNEQRMCGIQLKLGEKYLSNVCNHYPREFNKVNGVLEISTSISCPEAARKVLLNPEGIVFEEMRAEEDSTYMLLRNFDTQVHEKQNNIIRYFWELRIFTIQILQSRDYSLEDRLVILGLFYQNIQNHIDEGEIESCLATINKYTRLVQNGDFQGILAEIPTSVTVQMGLLKGLGDMRLQMSNINKTYKACYMNFLEGIEFDETVTPEQTGERYRNAYEHHFKPFMNEHGYILENYLVNYVFKNAFPIGMSVGKTVFDEYMKMVLNVSIVKLQLIGLSRYHGEQFSTDHVIQLLYSFSKSVEHNATFLNQLYQILRDNNFNTMAYMSILIKN